jgi:hypothetical protein
MSKYSQPTVMAIFGNFNIFPTHHQHLLLRTSPCLLIQTWCKCFAHLNLKRLKTENVVHQMHLSDSPKKMRLRSGQNETKTIISFT